MVRAVVVTTALALAFSTLACPSPTPTQAPDPQPAATLTPEQARAEVVLFARGMMAVRLDHQRQVEERNAFSAAMADTAPDVAVERFTDFLEQSEQLHSRVSEMRTPSTVKAALVHGVYISAFSKERETLSELFKGLLFGDLAKVDAASSMAKEAEALFRQADAAFEDLLDAYGIQRLEASPQ